jgi:hypothetical protein
MGLDGGWVIGVKEDLVLGAGVMPWRSRGCGKGTESQNEGEEV